MKTFLPLSSLFFCLTACINNSDVERAENSDPESIYQDYQVWAEEGREDVTVRLQFRAGGEGGDAVPIESPGAVLLDNLPVAADSTRFTGIYYETLQPIDEFKGPHTITYVDKAKKQQRVEFSFVPFSLVNEMTEERRKVPFEIRLDNFPDDPTSIRLIMIDTSHLSADVNEEVIVEDGKIAITAEHLANLTKGPVLLEINRVVEKPLKGKSNKGGKLTITYSLKREFTMVE